MKKVMRDFSVYGITYFVLLVVVAGLLIAYPKVELHLLLNSCHSDFQDVFFKYYSMLAEWPFYIIALLPLLWKKKEITLFYAICELSTGAVVQIVKHIFFAPRPISVFENYPDLVLPLVEGVRLHHSNSFPSGHTSTFFVFFTCCALLMLAYKVKVRAKYLMLVLMVALAALGGYSRIYLSQHFTEDVFVGSIIGFVTPCLLFYFAGEKILKLKLED